MLSDSCVQSLQQKSEVRSQNSEELRHSDALQHELDGSTFLHSTIDSITAGLQLRLDEKRSERRTLLGPGSRLVRDALQVAHMHQMGLLIPVELDIVHIEHVVQDLTNDARRTRWNKPRGPCSDSIADTKLEQATHT